MSILSDLHGRLRAIVGDRKRADADWPRAAADFDWDGSLRDIYVLGADMNDWQKVVDVIRHTYPHVEFTVDGEAATMPDSVGELFEMREASGLLLAFQVGRSRLHCHFFGSGDIEFDLDPQSVDGGESFEALKEFMRLLGDRSGKTVVLTPENLKGSPILRYAPGDPDVMWLPPAHHPA